TTLGTVRVSALGAKTTIFTVPAGARGGHKVEAVGAKGGIASATFSVTPSLSLSPATGAVGTTVSATLRGFKAGVKVDVRWYNGTSFRVLKTVTTSSTGGASTSFRVPSGAARGGHKVEAKEQATAFKASKTFTVTGAAIAAAAAPTERATVTATAVKTVRPSVTAVPTSTATSEPTAVPTEPELEPTANDTATPEPTATSTVEPTETPTPEPTPTETVEADAAEEASG
ncbi:MAG: hypothetical protein QOF01_2812, partial [Thermomicrobiales bacterium]|nr:hypothetical protein [Thermomicrobiales bacterium]